MIQFCVVKRGDFIYDLSKCSLYITTSESDAIAYTQKCDFETSILLKNK